MTKARFKRQQNLSDEVPVALVRERILLKNQIPTTWPEGVEEALVAIAGKPTDDSTNGVMDLTQVPFVTIDGKDARDFDDAVYCRQGQDGFDLDVAIADVSRWVERDNALDDAAKERGNSVYLPGHVVPMLPELLSNDLCSLNPGEVRFALVCRMKVTHQGKIDDYEFVEARIQSAGRLIYEEVSEFLEQPDSVLLNESLAVRESLMALDTVSSQFLSQRRGAGSLQLEFAETDTFFDDDGHIESMASRPRLKAARLIEECMLAANVCAGQTLECAFSQAIYRCHDAPDRDAINMLREIFGMFGVTIDGGRVPNGESLSRALASAKHAEIPLSALQVLVLRSMKQAVYSPSRAPHYGLGFETYTHFTSPIRRYPDLIAHRLLKIVLNRKKTPESDYSEPELAVIADHCSSTERRAEIAEREIMAWLKGQFMRQYVGHVFSGTVSGIAEFGAFVTLDDFSVEGMIHVSELGRGYFEFDERHMTLAAHRTGERVRLGDTMRVRVAGVQPEEGKIDFIRVSDEGDRAVSSRSRKRNSSRQNQPRPRRRVDHRRRH
jgi:ribonuclease R